MNEQGFIQFSFGNIDFEHPIKESLKLNKKISLTATYY